MRLAVLVLAAAIALPTSAAAQVARVRGTVKNDQGAPIKGAVVTARNPNAQPGEFTAATNERGEWAILGLRSGVWSIEVVADGFEATHREVNVSSFDRNRTFDFTLAAVRPDTLVKLDADAIQEDLKAADEHAAAERWDEAISAYRDLMRKVPALTTLYLPLGRVYRNAGRYGESVAAFKAYLGIHARSQVGLLELGRTYLASGDTVAASASLRQAADVNPSTTNAAEARALLEKIK